jgi:hypothetical protein
MAYLAHVAGMIFGAITARVFEGARGPRPDARRDRLEAMRSASRRILLVLAIAGGSARAEELIHSAHAPAPEPRPGPPRDGAIASVSFRF